MTDEPTRNEHDALGEFSLPADAMYGIATARAAANFTVSGLRMPRPFIAALGQLKRGAALANKDLELLDPPRADAIAAAAQEVAEGAWDDAFVVDVFQTGSGTSTNMNANEVIANRANELLGGTRGSYAPIHPNDDVNRGQSSNDIIPTALHLAAIVELKINLLPALYRLEASFQAKAAEFDGVLKTGRTHLMDATPIRLGQEFTGYAGQVERARRRLVFSGEALREVALGGTAVGTGVNTHAQFAPAALGHVNRILRLQLRETSNHFQAQSTMDAVVETSGALRVLAVSLMKVANDLRLMASGPRAGFGEITLPALQPGSSIMPGKVNPVIPEMVVQVGAQVIGNDATIGICGQWGFFELNTMWPVAAKNLLESIQLLSRASTLLAGTCVDGIAATDEGPARVESGLSLATPLAEILGYDRTSALVKEALASHRTIREVAAEQSGLSEDELRRVLDPMRMTRVLR
ncbi:MAG: class II fumarate hydratase [Dehalococcoidia bacterium]|nr:class II fumarate hydratase [Dehalococcoidia bacterium]MCB9486990.1 class II fumarate hydratase [Thermoflexaceae bacterium]